MPTLFDVTIHYRDEVKHHSLAKLGLTVMFKTFFRSYNATNSTVEEIMEIASHSPFRITGIMGGEEVQIVVRKRS